MAKFNKNNKSKVAARTIPHVRAVAPVAVAGKKEQSRIGRGPTKTFQQDGHWIVKTQKTVVLMCACGNRYLKTRPQQVTCLRCMAYLSSGGR